VENRRNGKKQLDNQHRKPHQRFDPFLGTSPAICALAQKANKLSFTKSSILIQGETGTGKGVLAAWLHDHSPCEGGPFVDLNCAALSRDLLESDLFGHEKGAFTGAVTTKMGLFEIAHGGAIFLDEIGDMDLQVQPKLLKVIEEKRFRRLGDVHERPVDVRLIAATHKDLSLLVRENRFRSDLYFRINTLSLKLPPLRERPEDIPILARRILNELAVDLGRDKLSLSSDLEKILQAHHWPGNIRELRNVLERAVLLSKGNILTSRDLQIENPLDVTPSDLTASDLTLDSKDQILTLSELERQYIEKVLQIEQGRIEAAAKRLGLSRSALYEKIKKHGVSLSRAPKCSVFDLSFQGNGNHKSRTMTPYPLELRLRIVAAVDQQTHTIEEVARLFGVSERYVYQLLKMRRESGDLSRSPRGGGAVAKLDEPNLLKLAELVAEFPDATLEELRELLRRRCHLSVSVNTVWRGLQQIDFTLKKSHAERAKTDRMSEPPSAKSD
jgi:DNA-binding NtrC family response regulator